MAEFGQARVPTEEEMKRLYRVAKGGMYPARNTAILMVSYKLGFRAKEIAALRVCDVLDDKGRLKEEIHLTGKMTKGNKQRVAYLTNPALRAALTTYLSERKEREASLFNVLAPLFKSQKGFAFSPNTMSQLLTGLHEQAGVIGGRSHSGRRWFATELIGKGVDLKSVSVLMGHASVSMTAKYAEANPQKLRRITAELV